MSDLLSNMKKKANLNPFQREYYTLPGEGVYKLRILQNILGPEEAPFEMFYLHKFIHPNFGNASNFKCIGHGCPMCEFVREYKRSHKGYNPYEKKQFFLYNIIDRRDGKLKILKASYTLHQAIFNEIEAMYKQQVNIVDFKYGRDVELTVRSMQNKTHYKFDTLPERESKNISDKIMTELKLVKPLEALYKDYTADELMSVLNHQPLEFKSQKEAPKKMGKKNLIDSYKQMEKKSGIIGVVPKDSEEKNEDEDLNKDFEKLFDSDGTEGKI